MEKQLEAILEAILAGVKVAGNFALDQLPDIATQYLLWGRVSMTVSVLLLGGVWAVFVWLFLRHGIFSKRPNDKYGHWPDGRVSCALFGGLFSLILGICFAGNLPSLFLVWFAPKVWLLKEIAHLVKP